MEGFIEYYKIAGRFIKVYIWDNYKYKKGLLRLMLKLVASE